MKRQRILTSLCFTILLLIVTGCSGDTSVNPDLIRASGFIEGRVYTIASALGGRVEQVLVTQGDTVDAGETLIILDATQLDFARDQAQAAIDAVQAELSALEDRPSSLEIAEALASVDTALAQLEGAEALASVDTALAQLEGAEAALELLNSSYEPLDPPESEVNAAESAIVVAGAGLTLAQAQMAQIEAGPLDEEGKILGAFLMEAEAHLDLIDIQMKEMNLVAQLDGIIQQVLNSEGEVVAPGSPIAYLMDPDYLSLTLYIPVTHIANIEYGDGVEITADSYPDEVFSGSVTRIADEAQFTPASVLTEEERVKLVFAVEVFVDDPSGRLKPGMPVDAVINP